MITQVASAQGTEWSGVWLCCWAGSVVLLPQIELIALGVALVNVASVM